MSDLELLSSLRTILTSRFSDVELRDVCFDLGVEYESLPGSGKADKARELISYLEHRERIDDLFAWVRQHRPDVSWQDAEASEGPQRDSPKGGVTHSAREAVVRRQMPEVREVEPRESQNLGTGANDKPHEAGHTARPELGEVAEDSPEQAQSIWVAGSFWLTSFIVVVTAVFVVSTQVDWYVLPITLAASICVLIVVGALVLTSRGQLEGDKFVQVVVKTLSQLPLLVGARRKRKTEETEEAEKTEDT